MNCNIKTQVGTLTKTSICTDYDNSSYIIGIIYESPEENVILEVDTPIEGYPVWGFWICFEDFYTGKREYIEADISESDKEEIKRMIVEYERSN